MKSFDARFFVVVSNVLDIAHFKSLLPKVGGRLDYVTDEGKRSQLDSIFARFEQSCVELELTASLASVRKLRRIISEPGPKKDMDFAPLAQELQERVIDELEGRLFWSLSANEAHRYMEPREGWGQVIDRFPSAITDIEEMNKCFALSRYAGAVFHSVQAIECGLLDFGTFLNVIDPKSGWTAVCGRLTTLVTKTKYPDLDPQYQKHFAFLEQMYGTIGALNSAWRNKISHAQGRLVLMTSEFSSDVNWTLSI
jgi:hypothetical protein